LAWLPTYLLPIPHTNRAAACGPAAKSTSRAASIMPPPPLAPRKRRRMAAAPPSSFSLPQYARWAAAAVVLLVVVGAAAAVGAEAHAEEESYGSYLWRRAHAIWEAATGELPLPQSTTTGSTTLLGGDGESSGNTIGHAADDGPAAAPLSGVRLGWHLLHARGDAAGAELVCREEAATQAQAQATDGKADALTCLGEARLALHRDHTSRAKALHGSNQSPSSSRQMATTTTVDLYRSQARQALRAARDALEGAVRADPANARARLGLGTALLLLSSSSSSTSSGQEGAEAPADADAEAAAAQWLLGATQHLEAAARMAATSSSSPSSSTSPSSSQQLRLGSLHNLALAHLALGDAAAAAGPMRELSAALPSSGLGGATEQRANLNLGSALVQAGAVEEGMQVLERIEARYCRRNRGNSTSASSSASSLSSSSRLCSIVYNNLGLAREIQTATDDGEGGPGGDMVATTEEYYDSSVAALPNPFNTYNRNAHAQTRGIPPDNRGGGELEEERGGSSSSQRIGISDQWKAAIEALEAIVDQGPDNARSWASLAKARGRAGDHAGALKAAARGVSIAHGKDEMDLANSALEEALSGLAAGEERDGSGGDVALAARHPPAVYGDDHPSSPAEVRALRLEQEVLNLKFQLLEQRVGGNFAPTFAGIPDRQHRDAWGASFVHEDDEEYSVKSGSISPEMASMPSASDSQMKSIHDADEDLPSDPGRDASSVTEDIIEEQALHKKDTAEVNKESNDDVSVTIDATEEEPQQHSAVYGAGDDEGLEIGEERSIGEPDEDTTVAGETNVSKESEKVDTEPQTSTADTKVEKEKMETKPDVELPDLYSPPQSQPPSEVPAIVPSYMKLADAYMQKENYPLAQKQFKKVLKKAPSHIPAILGYATAIERSGNPKKILEASLAYGNATKAALAAGDDRLATIALRRATTLCSTTSGSEEKLKTLRELAELAFTSDIAMEVYYAIGTESMAGASDGEETSESHHNDALTAFKIANGFACLGKEDVSVECHGHGGSLGALARLTLHEDANESLRYASLALKNDGIDDEKKIDAHVVAGQAKMVRYLDGFLVFRIRERHL